MWKKSFSWLKTIKLWKNFMFGNCLNEGMEEFARKSLFGSKDKLLVSNYWWLKKKLSFELSKQQVERKLFQEIILLWVELVFIVSKSYWFLFQEIEIFSEKLSQKLFKAFFWDKVNNFISRSLKLFCEFSMKRLHHFQSYPESPKDFY